MNSFNWNDLSYLQYNPIRIQLDTQLDRYNKYQYCLSFIPLNSYIRPISTINDIKFNYYYGGLPRITSTPLSVSSLYNRLNKFN